MPSINKHSLRLPKRSDLNNRRGGSHQTLRWRKLDSNFQFPDIVQGSFFGRSQPGSVAEPKVCRLAAGGKWIRTISPAEDARYPDLRRLSFAPPFPSEGSMQSRDEARS